MLYMYASLPEAGAAVIELKVNFSLPGSVNVSPSHLSQGKFAPARDRVRRE